MPQSLVFVTYALEAPLIDAFNGAQLVQLTSDGQITVIGPLSDIVGIDDIPFPDLDDPFEIGFDLEVLGSTDDTVYFRVDPSTGQDQVWRISASEGAQQLTSPETESELLGPTITSDVAQLGRFTYFASDRGFLENSELARVGADGVIETVDIAPDIAGVQTLFTGNGESRPRDFVEFGDRLWFAADRPDGLSQLHSINRQGDIIRFDRELDQPNVQALRVNMAESFERRGDFLFQELSGPRSYRVQEDGTFERLTVTIDGVEEDFRLAASDAHTVEVGGRLLWFNSIGLVGLDRQNNPFVFDADPDQAGLQVVNNPARFVEVNGTLIIYSLSAQTLFALDIDGGLRPLTLGETVGGEAPFGPDQLTVVGDEVYFVATSGGLLTDQREGSELWRVTADGVVEHVDIDSRTAGIQTIFPGQRGSGPDNLIENQGHLYFSAESEFESTEIWVVTPNGRVQMLDFDRDAPGVQPANPGAPATANVDLRGEVGEWTEFGGDLYFVPFALSIGEVREPVIFRIVDGIFAEAVPVNGAMDPRLLTVALSDPAREIALLETTLVDVEIIGTPGRDRLEGDGGDNVLRGLNGRDTLAGLGGDDQLLGGAGNDRLFGGNGRDVLNGQNGNDTVSGGSGADRLLGGNGQDRLSGNAGNDVLLGGAGNDVLTGGRGNDNFNGGGGRDTFVFAGNIGANTIRSFELNRDVIDLSDITSINSFRDLRSIARDIDGDTVIRVDGRSQSITLADIDEAELSGSNFIFN